jgi:hypothetical protein
VEFKNCMKNAKMANAREGSRALFPSISSVANWMGQNGNFPEESEPNVTVGAQCGMRSL